MIDPASVTVTELEADPYPIYAELRDHSPAAYLPCLDVWAVTRWDDVNHAVTDATNFPASVGNSPTDRALGGVSMMTTDGEPAKSRRRPFDATLRPRSVETSMPQLFAKLCDERLDIIALAGKSDLVTDYFEPVSLLSLAHAMGIHDLVDVPTLRRWFYGLAAGIGNYEDDPAKWAKCQTVSDEIDEVLQPRFAQRLANPDGGMISNLAHATDGSPSERLAWAMPSFKLVLMAGLQEPAHGAATTAFCLLTHPAQMASVTAVPELIPAAVDEGLRWTAPIGNLLRGVLPGASLGEVAFPDEARVILIVASANRDREVWGPTADEFDIHRPRRNHMSFAAGPHYCIGHHFARRQLQVAIGRLLDRFPRVRLYEDDPPVLRGHEYRSPTSLLVAVE